jgi:hypothetical protein
MTHWTMLLTGPLNCSANGMDPLAYVPKMHLSVAEIEFLLAVCNKYFL